MDLFQAAGIDVRQEPPAERPAFYCNQGMYGNWSQALTREGCHELAKTIPYRRVAVPFVELKE